MEILRLIFQIIGILIVITGFILVLIGALNKERSILIAPGTGILIIGAILFAIFR